VSGSASCVLVGGQGERTTLQSQNCHCTRLLLEMMTASTSLKSHRLIDNWISVQVALLRLSLSLSGSFFEFCLLSKHQFALTEQSADSPNPVLEHSIKVSSLWDCFMELIEFCLLKACKVYLGPAVLFVCLCFVFLLIHILWMHTWTYLQYRDLSTVIVSSARTLAIWQQLLRISITLSICSEWPVAASGEQSLSSHRPKRAT